MRARYPDREGYVESHGVPIFYEEYGDGDRTVLVIPPWQVLHSRTYKAQIPYLSRHFRLITYDPPGNGRSGRPATGFDHDTATADALAVLDATNTAKASLICLSRAAWQGVILAAECPDRVERLVLTGCALDETTRPGFHEALYSHLAGCDLAVVQGGLSTCMELTAAKRPFLYFPLKNHFEQNIHVSHRLARYGAGVRMEYDRTDPETLAYAIADGLKRPVIYRDVEADGARGAAALIARLL